MRDYVLGILQGVSRYLEEISENIEDTDLFERLLSKRLNEDLVFLIQGIVEGDIEIRDSEDTVGTDDFGLRIK